MSDSDLLKELDSERRAERLKSLIRRHSIAAAVMLIVVLAIFGGWRFWKWQQYLATEKASIAYLQTMQMAAPQAGGDISSDVRQKAIQQYKEISEHSPESIRTLARLQEAGLAVDKGDIKTASQIWESIQSDSRADPIYRSLASLLWVQSHLDQGDPAQLRSRLAVLNAENNPWHALVQEAEALLDIRIGKNIEARKIFAQLVQDNKAPSGVKRRANFMLQAIAENKADQ